jgi:hypothetical protein
MIFWRENCARRFEANKAVNDVEESRLYPWPPKKYTETFSAKAETLLANTLKHNKKSKSHEEIELNFDASCQQILSLESEILWEACSTPTLAGLVAWALHRNWATQCLCHHMSMTSGYRLTATLHLGFRKEMIALYQTPEDILSYHYIEISVI